MPCAQGKGVSNSKGAGILIFVFLEVGADQHWPYGLVDDEDSEFQGRKLEGDFFAGVKNSRLFLRASEQDADAREKRVEADAHLNSIDQKATQFMKGGPNRQHRIVEREVCITALTKTVLQVSKIANSPWSWVARAWERHWSFRMWWTQSDKHQVHRTVFSAGLDTE